MPTFPRKAARRTLLPAAVLTVMASLGAPVLGQTGSSAYEAVVSSPDGGTPVTVPLEDVFATSTVGPTTYKVRRRPGNGYDRVFVPDGSAATVAEILGAARGLGLKGDYAYVEIDRPGPAGSLVLSKRRIRESGGDPPAVFVEDGELTFIRSSTGSRDVNKSDYFPIPGGSIDLGPSNESPLGDVLIRCPTTSVEAGEKLTCSARVSGARGDDYRFEFDFGEGDPKVVPAPGYSGYKVFASHTYEKSGDYEISVLVTTNGETSDNLSSPEIAVSEKPGESDPSGGTGTSQDFLDDFNSYITPGTTTTTPPSTYDSSPSYDYDFGGDVPKTTRDENTVEGNLLASLTTPAGSAPGSAAASSGGSAQAATATFELPESDDEVPPAAWAGVGALALFGLGAGLESGRLSRQSLRRPRLSLRRR